ncbi:coiled-coil domain-containing protein 96 [Epinephelus fuscoguttatus]|uniref:coiled-coil domain-containing protein 96 n=1 Tax=Epinephelus fuscoguttatus TaxID=293821 RepID=UPI0020D1BF10|nr:coiled-coil domain-containing protein 96 [Epinephelus fuscoguttatus]
MDGEAENEVKINGRVSADSTNEEDTSPAVYGNEKEGVPDEMVASDHDEEDSESMKATEEAATSEPEDNSGNEFHGVDHMTSSEGLDVKMKEVNEQLMSHEESVVFEINSTDGDGPPRLHFETPERQSTTPTQEEDETEEKGSAAAPAHKEDISNEEYMQLHQKLCEDRNIVSQHHSQLQTKLAEFFRRKAWDDAQLEREMSEQLLEYERCINILTDLKQQITANMETAQQQTEELRLKSQEKLNKVETEWRAITALKQDVAVAVLSRCLGKEVAQAKVEATLATEKLLQDKLNKLCLKHIKLRIKIHRLETELCEGEGHARDPLQLQFERLQTERLEQKKHTEKQNEECLKMQKKISSSEELLSNVKEKLFWSQMEIQAKREQLATLEAMVATKRDILTRSRQASSGLQRDNLRLKEHRGLRGNRVLMQDFEDSVDASDHRAKHLEDLKCLQAEIVFRCGRWKKKLEII